MPLLPTAQPELTSPGDFTAIRNQIFQTAKEAVVSRFPVENDQYSLTLEDVDYDGGIPEYTKEQQKQAIYNDASLTAKLRGRWLLTDKATGKVVSKSSLRKIMDVPYLTERGVFIRNGAGITLPIQMRLVPGVYTRMADDGMVKTQVNVRQGTGKAMQVTMDPANPVFKVVVGTRNYKLYPLLRHLGVDDKTIIQAWGRDIYDINRKDFVAGGGWYGNKKAADEEEDLEALMSFEGAVVPDPPETPDTPTAPVEEDGSNPYDVIANEVIGGELDPINTQFTFGKAYDKVTPELLLQSAGRMVRVSRGEIEQDNRDSLENQRFFMAPELLRERIRLDAGGLAKNILWKASRKGGVDKIPPGALTRYMHGLFTESGLANVIEDTNPLDAYQRATKVTRMGEGGISSMDSAPMSARMVHNTYKGFIDPVATPESLRVGLDTQLAIAAKRGPDGLMYSPLIDGISGKRKYVSSIESSTVPVAFEEFRNSKDPLIPAMIGNNIEYLPKAKVRYWTPNGDSLFSLASNFIPMRGGIKAGRLLMAQKHQTQAMSLTNRMAPFVQTLDPEDGIETVEQKYANILGAVKAPATGKVLKVSDDMITLLTVDGQKRDISLYKNFPLNRRSLISNTPTVKPGDIVKQGQLLATSNYTDEQGSAALGTQLRTGWLSYKGYNNLDGIVISEGAAKKLTSEYLYHQIKPKEDGVIFDKGVFVGAFPTKFTKTQLETIGANGAVKKGTILRKGDPVILASSARKPGPGTMYRTLKKDDSEIWDHNFDGEVIEVVDGKDGLKVFIRAQVPAQVGDKIAARYANKGTISYILPDDQMPKTADGQPLDVLLSPTGIVSRVNPAQIIEAALGKVAAKTGKRYKLPGFMEEDAADFAEKELKAAGLSLREDVIDPETGIAIPSIPVGNSYIVKFHHTSESKEGARNTGGYTADELPGGEGHSTAKTLGGLLLGAFVGHNTSEVLKDMKLVKGQKNTDFWRDFKMGLTPNTPKQPLIYQRFLAHLEGSGIHVTQEGQKTNIFALTDGDVKKYARAPVATAATYDAKNMNPIKGGLFDPAIFGQDGDQWGYIPLSEPVPNPVMEDVIKILLKLKGSEFEDVLAGRRKLSNGMTGGAGMLDQLKRIPVDGAIRNAVATIQSGKGAKRDKAIKELRYLTAMKRHQTTPDQFMLTRVPVLPPRFRRITESGGMTMVPDANYLYKQLIDMNKDVAEAQAAGVPAADLGDGRLGIYKAFKAVTGLGDPEDRKLQTQEIGGLLKWVFGKGSPKSGAFQRQVVGGRVDVAGRGVIDVDPELRLDEIGLPESQAWDLYKDFTIRKLAQNGHDVLNATKEVVNHSDLAKAAMIKVMEERPLIITRAPALHKFSVLAFRPKLIPGHSIMLNPVIEQPMNADLDGDQMTYYVPVTKKAVQEAYDKMMPSKNLLSARNFTAHFLPQEEYILGAHLAARAGKGPVTRTFATEQEAVQAYRRGEIGLNDNIQITEG